MEPTTMGLIGGAALGGIANAFSAGSANAASREQAVWANQLARENRDIARADYAAYYNDAKLFNERMASTAVQRNVADMKAAGINPMAAYAKGGGSPPMASVSPGGGVQGGPGATASVMSTRIGDAFERATSTAFESRKQEQEIAESKSRSFASLASGIGALAAAKTSDAARPGIKRSSDIGTAFGSFGELGQKAYNSVMSTAKEISDALDPDKRAEKNTQKFLEKENAGKGKK